MQACEETLVVGFLDVKRAHFVLRLEGESMWSYRRSCKRSMARTPSLNSSRVFTAECATRHLLVDVLGFVQGFASPCHDWHPGRGFRVRVHGDEFTSLGTLSAVSWFHIEIVQHWLVEARGIFASPRHRRPHSLGFVAMRSTSSIYIVQTIVDDLCYVFMDELVQF